MKEEYEQIIQRAKEEEKEIKKNLDRLKKRPPKDLDDQFLEGHERSFRKIDCLECANCCSTTSPIFRDIDIKRIAKKMKKSEGAFIDEFLRMDEDNDWVLKSSPCFFLQDDKKCSIYDFRPQACREYPHTNRKRMVQILDLTAKNTTICPAVALTVQEITNQG